MRRLTIHVEIAFGEDEPESPPEREAQLDTYIERANPDDVSRRSELDHRRPIGFHQETA